MASCTTGMRSAAGALVLTLAATLLAAPVTARADDASSKSPGASSATPPAPDTGAAKKPNASSPTPKPAADTKTTPAPASTGASAPAESAPSKPAESGASAPAESGAPAPAPVLGTVQKLNSGTGFHVNLVCTNCNAASLSVNGLSGDHVQVSWDGMPMSGGLSTVYHLTQIPSQLIGHTEIIRGPGSVLSGASAVGGAIELYSAPRDQRRAFLQAEGGDWGARSLKIAGGDKWGPVGALISAQFTHQNVVDADRDTYPDVARFDRLTVHGIFDFHLSRNQTLTLQGNSYGENQVDGVGRWYSPPILPALSVWKRLTEDARFNWRQFSAQWKLERPSGFTLTWTGRYSLRHQQQWAPPNDHPDVVYQRTFLIHDEMGDVGLRADRPVGAAGMLTAGAGWSNMRVHVVEPPQLAGTPYNISDGLQQYQAYAQYDRSVNAKWSYTVGARADRFIVFGKAIQDEIDPVTHARVPVHTRANEVSYTYPLPRAQVRFRPHPKVLLGLAAGRGAVGPRPVFEATCCGAKYARSIDLKPETSWSSQGTIEVHPTLDMRITTTLFRTDFEKYVERIVNQTALYVPEYSKVNLPHSRVQGVDVVHDMRFHDDMFNVGWTFTYTDAKLLRDYVDPKPLTGQPAAVLMAKGDALHFTPRTAASAYFHYHDLKRGTSVSVDARLTGPQTHFALAGAVLRSPHQKWGDLVSPTFETVDLKFEQRVGKKGWTAYAGVANATNYVETDLGEKDRCFDWGPLTGRFIYGGMRFEL